MKGQLLLALIFHTNVSTVVSYVLKGKKIAESYSKSPDINSWGAPVLLKAEIPLRTDHGKSHHHH